MPVQESLEQLITRLHFTETETMRQLHDKIVQIGAGPALTTGLFEQYAKLAEEVVNRQREQDAFQRAQIALILQVALILHACTLQDEYVERLREAFEYAETCGYEDIAERLRLELDGHS